MQDLVRSILDDFKLEGLEEQRTSDVEVSNSSSQINASDAETEWFKDLLNRAATFACGNSSPGLAMPNPGLNNA